MLSQCANAKCAKPFLKIREGKLFLVEAVVASAQGESATKPGREERRPVPRMKRYWLCDECAVIWTLVSDPQDEIALVPLRPPAVP